MNKIFRFLTLICLVLGFWQANVWYFQIPDYLLPDPLHISQILFEKRHLIFQHSLPTLLEILLGFSFGILFGCFAGLSVALFKPLRRWFLPALVISQAIPTFAIAPLLVLWLGYGLTSKVMTTVIMIFFPVASAFYDGLKNTPSEWLDLAKSMQASRWRTFYYIRIPAALPELASGIRIAAAIAPIGAIIGEWVGSSRGLGYLMITANARMQIDLMFAALCILMLLALALYFGVDKGLQRWVWW